MSNVVTIEKITSPAEVVFEVIDGKVWASSIQVAQVLGKDHKHVLEKYRSLEVDPEWHRSNFRPISYPDQYGREMPMIMMTRKGFNRVVMDFTGKKAGRIKQQLLDRYEELEEQSRVPALDPAKMTALDWIRQNKQLTEIAESLHRQHQEQLEANVKLAQVNRAIKRMTDTNHTYNFTEAKYMLFRKGEITRDTFIRALDELGFIHKFGNSAKSPWLPKSRYEAQGYFVVTNPKVGTDKVVEQCRITFDGLGWLYPQVCSHLEQPIDQDVMADINSLIVGQLQGQEQ